MNKFRTVLFSDRGLLTGAFLFAAIVLSVNLGGGGIPAAQEGRTAIIVRNMIRTGNYMDMNVEHGILYEKPVGHYWLCLPTALLFGAEKTDLSNCASEWAFRLPSVLSALLALIGAAILSARIHGARSAALTVVILSSMMTFNHLARLAHIDMPLCAAYTWAMVFLYIGYFERMKSNAWIYGFYLMLGWGMILKGPLVVILAGLLVLVMMIRFRRFKMIWELRPLSGGLVFLAASLPWYIAETVRTNGAFFEEFIMNQNVRRFTGVGSTYRNGERMSLFYYIPKMIAGTLPWSIPALFAAVFQIKKLIRLRLGTGNLFLFLWFLTGFVFFSLSALKRGDYLLPLYPPLAVLTAAAVLRGIRELPALTKYWIWVWGLLAGVCAGAAALSFSGVLIAFAKRSLDGTGFHIGRSDANNILLLSGFVNEHKLLAIGAAAALLGLLYFFGFLMRRRNYAGALTLLCTVLFGILILFNGYIDPASGDRYRSVKDFARKARTVVPPGEKVQYINDFNTELIYFMDRPYECGPIRTDIPYILTNDRGAASIEKEGGWTELFRTVENHQYPAVFLRRSEDASPAAATDVQ